MDLQSLGYVAGIYQRDPRIIKSALAVVQAESAAKAGQPIPHEAQPSLILNGLSYFQADEVVSAIGWLAERDAEKARSKAVEAVGNG